MAFEDDLPTPPPPPPDGPAKEYLLAALEIMRGSFTSNLPKVLAGVQWLEEWASSGG